MEIEVALEFASVYSSRITSVMMQSNVFHMQQHRGPVFHYCSAQPQLKPFMLVAALNNAIFKIRLHSDLSFGLNCRWSVISDSLDDRTAEERGIVPLKKDRLRIHKSRYDSVDSYLSPEAGNTMIYLWCMIKKYWRDWLRVCLCVYQKQAITR